MTTLADAFRHQEMAQDIQYFHVYFTGIPVVDGVTKWQETKKRFAHFKITRRKLHEKEYVLRYYQARLQYYNKNYLIRRTQAVDDTSQKKLDHVIEITTCKRMITKISNGIKRFEEHQKTLLIQNFDDPAYKKALEKLINYKERLLKAQETKIEYELKN